MKPQIKPTIAPHNAERTIFCFGVACVNRALGSVTGLTINLIPKNKVITNENPPIVVLGTLLETKLPTRVNSKTNIIITMPFLMSIFLFFP